MLRSAKSLLLLFCFAAPAFCATEVSWPQGHAVVNPEIDDGISIVCSGPVTIESELTLTNGSCLKIDSPSDGRYSIIVKSGGTLNLSANSKITANDPAKRYNIIYEAGSRGTIEASTIEYTYGDGSSGSGFVVKTTDLTIINSTIEGSNSYGIIFSGGGSSANNLNLTNSTVQNNQLGGVLVTGETFVNIHDNNFSGQSENIINQTAKAINSPPSIALTSLKNGGSLTGKSVCPITWQTNGGSALPGRPVSLYYSLDGGSSFSLIESVENTGSYQWPVPNLTSSAGRLKILVKDADNNSAADQSLSNFSIQLAEQVISSETGVRVAIPAGATTQTANVTIATAAGLEKTAPAGKVLASDIFDIRGDVSTFAAPIAITLPIKNRYLGYSPYYWDGSSWKTDGLAVTAQADSSVTFTTTHFSVYALFSAAITGTSPVAAPNPFNPLKESTSLIYFLDNGGPTTVYLLDLTGHQVWTKSYSTTDAEGGHAGYNQVTWDGRNLFGEVAENGLYIFKIVSGGKFIGTGKVIVLR